MFKVLPRQTCGLYTHTLKLKLYPGGPQVLNDMIHGGSLFDSVLYNRVSIITLIVTKISSCNVLLFLFDGVLYNRVST